MNLLKEIWRQINLIPADQWAIMVQIVFTGITLSSAGQAIKKLVMKYKTWLDDPRRREVVMNLYLIGGSLLASSLLYLRSEPRFSGWLVIPQGLLSFAVGSSFFLFFLKPLTVRLGLWIVDRIARATAINEAKAAAVPDTGLPITTEEF